VFCIEYENNVGITLMFLIVAEKSRTFSHLPHSADEQACRSWEGAQPASWPKLASGNIHTMDIMLSL